ncbi:MAG: DUF1566 domain-containing protein [Desulfuromonadales bacterium]|nr:DUF1566 domain-containing protein [Desulfuromonadales bacterium]
MHKSVTTFILIALISLPATAFAEMALVPQSGQVLCYDAAGVDIPCAGTGQDGDQQMGVPGPNPRFTDNGNGTVTDNLTGLIWLKNASCLGQRQWTAALSSANTLANGACGLTDGSIASDWRLPNKEELESLINRQQSNPAAWLNTVGFSGVNTSTTGSYYEGYWTSSSSSTDYAWYVSFGIGKTNYPYYKGYNIYAWPVRGGQ